jgi:hypothetical protein
MPSKIEGSLTVLDQRLLQLYMTPGRSHISNTAMPLLWGYVTKGQPYLTFAADHPAPRELWPTRLAIYQSPHSAIADVLKSSAYLATFCSKATTI